MTTTEIKDTATFDGMRLQGTFHYDWPEPHSRDITLCLCPPDQAAYWTAVNGICRSWKVEAGETCMANVESLVRLANPEATKAIRWDASPIYVTFAHKNSTAGAWQRWVKKWASRTRL